MVTIHDIARLAEVSISTVSKVLNGKGQNLSNETRERVRKIARQYNYTPYAETYAGKPTFLIGVMIGTSADYALITGLMQQARAHYYSTIVCNSHSMDEELRNYEILLSHKVDGIIWVRDTTFSDSVDQAIRSKEIPFRILSENASRLDSFFSYEALGYCAAKRLIDGGHINIASISSEMSTANQRFAEGIRRALFEKGISSDTQDNWISATDCDADWLQAHTGVICLDSAAMTRVAGLVDRLGLRIPENLSILSLCEEDWVLNGVRITKLQKPYEEFGAYTIDQMVGQIEGEAVNEPFHTTAQFCGQASIAPPIEKSRKRFVIVGPANMDTLISVEKQLEPGETVQINHRMIIPGGKGLNQSLGVAKLGGDAALITSLGSDPDGRCIFDHLKSKMVCTDGVSMSDGVSTGSAYIYVQEDAESSISVYPGANSRLCSAHITENERLFAGAEYCLLQTEIAPRLVLEVARMAKKHGVKVILKPCVIAEIDVELLRQVDIIVPNRKEAAKLVPFRKTIEEQAEWFLEQGVCTAIITLGDQGCFQLDHDGGAWFPAAPISPVDATGAADAFIASLAVYLSRGKAMREAIRYATCAAGLSTTRHGVPSALVDMDTLETFYSTHQSELQERPR